VPVVSIIPKQSSEPKIPANTFESAQQKVEDAHTAVHNIFSETAELTRNYKIQDVNEECTEEYNTQSLVNELDNVMAHLKLTRNESSVAES